MVLSIADRIVFGGQEAKTTWRIFPGAAHPWWVQANCNQSHEEQGALQGRHAGPTRQVKAQNHQKKKEQRTWAADDSTTHFPGRFMTWRPPFQTLQPPKKSCCCSRSACDENWSTVINAWQYCDSGPQLGMARQFLPSGFRFKHVTNQRKNRLHHTLPPVLPPPTLRPTPSEPR